MIYFIFLSQQADEYKIGATENKLDLDIAYNREAYDTPEDAQTAYYIYWRKNKKDPMSKFRKENRETIFNL